MTSQLNSTERIGDYLLQEWKEAGLPKATIVRMKFATVHESVIVKKVGRLATQDQIEVEKNLMSFFSS